MTNAAAARPPELHRPVVADQVGDAWFGREINASPAELSAIAARLDVPAVAFLTARFRLRRLALREDDRMGAILAEGHLAARVTRVCVISLEEFDVAVEEDFRVRFVRAGDEREDVDLEADDDIGYADGVLDLGEATVEQLALALDPFPRKPDAILPPHEDDAPAGPFAGLAARKRGP